MKTKPGTTKAYIAIAVLATLTVALLNFQKNFQFILGFNNPPALVYTKSKIKPEDLAPLPIPKSAIAAGKALLLPILMYHHVGMPPKGSDLLRSGLTVSPQNFEQQVAWLKQQGYHSVSFNDLYLYSQKKLALPRKPIIFSFDDGYDDVFINAVPILQKYGYSGSFGIITNFPGTISGTNSYAGWDQIAAAKTAGMEILCHTQNHFDGSNPKFTSDYILQNLSGCQAALAEHFGSNEPYLIYPYGHYNQVYIEQAKKAGFVMAATVHEGKWINLQNLMELPRIRVGAGESLEKFKETISN